MSRENNPNMVKSQHCHQNVVIFNTSQHLVGQVLLLKKIGNSIQKSDAEIIKLIGVT